MMGLDGLEDRDDRMGKSDRGRRPIRLSGGSDMSWTSEAISSDASTMDEGHNLGMYEVVLIYPGTVPLPR
jgi:hypothetical protein